MKQLITGAALFLLTNIIASGQAQVQVSYGYQKNKACITQTSTTLSSGATQQFAATACNDMD